MRTRPSVYFFEPRLFNGLGPVGIKISSRYPARIAVVRKDVLAAMPLLSRHAPSLPTASPTSICRVRKTIAQILDFENTNARACGSRALSLGTHSSTFSVFADESELIGSATTACRFDKPFRELAVIDLPPFDAVALSLHHSPGVHAILVGSGLSRAAGIPTGWEITVDLIRNLAALNKVNEHDDWPQWYREKYDEEPSYSEIIAKSASTSVGRRAILHRYIDPPEGEDIRKPTKAHHAIARLVASGAVHVVITTNFDRLIENALREAGVEPTVIAGEDAISGATPLVHSKCTIIKVHGDYLDARIKNTDAELEDYSPAMNHLLDQVFDNFGLLIVGWSGEWDTALRSAILRAPSRRYPLYLAARGVLVSSHKISWSSAGVGASR
jgi:SIR2-like domain